METSDPSSSTWLFWHSVSTLVLLSSPTGIVLWTTWCLCLYNPAYIFRKLILDTSYDVKPVQMNLLGDGYKEMAVMGSGSSSEGDSKVWMVLCSLHYYITNPSKLYNLSYNLTWSFTIIWRTGSRFVALVSLNYESWFTFHSYDSILLNLC